ncbi:MAG: FeoB-associated Cys-rich membrane protein [Clostridia bacterium]|nr:FeoB-associated Cys-rich membrane protein [Clostridia bacterium]
MFLSFLKANIGTIVVALILIALLSLVTYKVIKDKKKGKSSCGCGCANCPMSGQCHNK